jgi:hemerythrin-like domain-containing protein
MCDYCGCRAVPVIDELGSEHETLLRLAGETRRALGSGDDERARALLAELLDLHAEHSAVEEASILTAMAPELGEVVDRLVQEHRDAPTTVAELDGADWPAPAVQFLDDLADHISREEYDLFPAALLVIGLGDWDDVERAASEMRARAR